jgi:hypothetical protein
MPVHVRAGSIVPFGPELQWTGEKPADPVTLFVYAGADGAFTLYEDDGLTYSYEKGAFARIPLRWNDAAGTLTIGKREGSFPGMLASRTFEVVLVGKTKPVGFSFQLKPDRPSATTGPRWRSRWAGDRGRGNRITRLRPAGTLQRSGRQVYSWAWRRQHAGRGLMTSSSPSPATGSTSSSRGSFIA